jgi:L-seryl-tRNA(Ser) seleniumtransferase
MSLREIPAVDQLLRASDGLISVYGRPLTLSALRTMLDEAREAIRAGGAAYSEQKIVAGAGKLLNEWTRATLEPVINATGVILHTNLGRAPLSNAALRAMEAVSSGYSNLEFDLKTGKRGSRLLHAEAVLQKLTGADAALVVNNCASAVLLVLTALANRKPVIIPRSQLVEIGGGFRVPDVMKQSGAKLVEIGTTNKVRIADYEEALTEKPAGTLVMRAHRSNFKIIGFTEEPALDEVVQTAHAHGLIFVDDLGSGALLDTSRFGMLHEPMVQESIRAGVDVVMFSGDKLLGGPQAGIIIGRVELIAKVRKHPLARALRADKTCLAGLTASLMHYLKDEAEREIPIWRMISQPLESLKNRALAWQIELGCGEVLANQSTVGGGSLPGETLPTWVFSLAVKSPDKFLARLRKNTPPLIARTENERVLFDPRTIPPALDAAVLACIKTALMA